MSSQASSVASFKSTRLFQYRSRNYSVIASKDEPWTVTFSAEGFGTKLPALGGVHSTAAWDGLSKPRLVAVKKDETTQVWTFEANSTQWKKFRTIWTLEPDACRVHHEVEGEGTVGSVSFFEAVKAESLPDADSCLSLVRKKPAPLRHYSIPSTYFHEKVFCPQPYGGRDPHRSADDDALLTVASTFGPVDFNTWFSPGLFCFGLLTDGEKGLYCGLGAPLGQHLYHSLRYLTGGGGWGFSVEFDGMLAVNGKWTSPVMELRWAETVASGLRAHVASGKKQGWFPQPSTPPPSLWKRPIFCGWGQQQVWTRPKTKAKGNLQFLDQLISPSATALATEGSYREMVRLLEKEKLPFGTVTIDFAWSTSSTIPVVDQAKWSDLRGFIAEQHKKGRKVLLWLSCWGPKPAPEYTMKSSAGLPQVVDPTLPAFRAALKAAIHEAISPDGLGADGFKLDFTGDIPRGQGYEPHAPLWGLELLRDYVGFIYESLKEAKAEAILETHCGHPVFADRTDILRLNDIFEDRTDIRPMMKHRALMARIASPNWLIDTDNDPFISEKAWWDYMKIQPSLGIPSLMTISHMCRSTQEVTKEHMEQLIPLWQAYYKKHRLAP